MPGACGLWARATQTVFGDGPINARLLVVGEQPGNSEDLEGAPFVGSAPDEVRDQAYAGLVADLKAAATWLARASTRAG